MPALQKMTVLTLKCFLLPRWVLKNIDPQFKQEVSWTNLQLDQFNHEFLNGEAVIQPDKNIDAANLENALQQFQPQLLIVYGYFQKLQRHARRWANANNIPVAYISDSEMRQHRNRLKELVKYFFVRNYFSKINYFLSVGNANEAYYRHHGVAAEKIIRMHFPIDIVHYRPAFAEKTLLRQKIRQQYAIADNEMVLTVTGKLVAWKNQDHIIQAMQLLEEENIFCHLLVLGSGDMMEPWKKQAAVLKRSTVHFAGFVAATQLPAYYAAADVYVHPASVEPHSIAVSEAIYMGCPVVISDRCGSYGETDDVQQNKNGLVYPLGNISALAAAIKQLLQNKTQREAYAGYSHNIAEKFQHTSHVTVLQQLAEKIKPLHS